MNTTRHASKEQVRAYMARRMKSHTPPPELEQIKRELGLSTDKVERSAMSNNNLTM